jgi:hypothetical protein
VGREDVDVEGILDGLRLVPDVGRDVQHLARAHEHDFLLVLADPELEAALEDVGELLVLVLVARYDAALLEVDVREHGALTGDEPAREHGGDVFLRHLFPAIVGDCVGCHGREVMSCPRARIARAR